MKTALKKIASIFGLLAITAALPPALVRADEVATTQPAAAPAAPAAAPGSGPMDELTNLSLEDLMNVQVTSVSKTKQRLGDSAAAVAVISQDDIQRSGLHDIPDMLRLAPGLFVQRGNQFTGWSVSSRGFGALFSNKLLVLEDGRTLYTPLFSGVYWNTVDYPAADLDRIEVIRGPGATLWGANAVNGVINITSKSAQDTQGILVDGRTGTDESDATVRYGGKIDDNTYYRIYGKGESFNDMKSPDTEAASANEFQDSTGGFRVDHIADKDTLTLQSDGFYQRADDQLVTGHILTDYTHDYRSGENILGRWTHVDSATADYNLQVYYDRINLRDGFTTFDNNAFDTQWQQRFQLFHGNEFMYGLGARFATDDTGQSTLPAPVIEPSARYTYVLSTFAQDTQTLIPDRLNFTLGSKLESSYDKGLDLEPSARLLWTPAEDTSVWTAISRADRTPSRIEWDDDLNIITPLSPGKVERQVKGTDKPVVS